jgi:type VI secretion system protein ImpG
LRDELLAYYERELTFLRQMGAEFAARYPKIASRLTLEPDRVEDPHVERMAEAFAFLAARVHLKVDDEFPEITSALLNIIYPHYLRPIPSMTVVEFFLDPAQGKLTGRMDVPKHSMLLSRPYQGAPCRFRTCYPTAIWPLAVTGARWRAPERLDPPVRAPEAAAALRLDLTCLPDVAFRQLGIDSLRFYLNGESNLIHSLWELLAAHCTRILVRDPMADHRSAPMTLPASALRPVGFAEEDDVLPYPRRSFLGYRILQEYFCMPEKFFFFELSGLEGLLHTFKERLEITFLISPFEHADRQQALEVGVSQKTFRLNCCPVVNLFPQTADPVTVDGTRYEYPVIPDVRRRNLMEVYSVDEVLSSRPDSKDVFEYDPLYAYRHAGAEEGRRTFWHTTRRPSGRSGDEGTDVFITLVGFDGHLASFQSETLTLCCTCTNRDLPSRLPFGNTDGDFEIEGMPAIHKIVALRKPTPSVRPPLGGAAFWRLVSHLSLNYLSLVEDGKEAFQEILKLYEFTGSAFLDKQIRGITGLNSRPHFAPVRTEHGIVFARGKRIEIEFDEEQFVGGGVLLFATVIERFLGLYASLNSFSQLIARTKQRKDVLKEWPPRAGDEILI